MLPVAVKVVADTTLAPVMLPDAPEVMMLLEVILPVVDIELLPNALNNVTTFELPYVAGKPVSWLPLPRI